MRPRTIGMASSTIPATTLRPTTSTSMAKLPNRESAARREAPVPWLTTTGRPADQQRDKGDRARHIRFELSSKTLVALVLVVASLWLLVRLWTVLLVLVVALLLAGTLSPAVRWIEKRRVGRRVGIAIVFTIFFILGVLVVVLTGPTLASQATTDRKRTRLKSSHSNTS